jgi:hypothetical protein
MMSGYTLLGLAVFAIGMVAALNWKKIASKLAT